MTTSTTGSITLKDGRVANFHDSAVPDTTRSRQYALPDPWGTVTVSEQDSQVIIAATHPQLQAVLNIKLSGASVLTTVLNKPIAFSARDPKSPDLDVYEAVLRSVEEGFTYTDVVGQAGNTLQLAANSTLRIR